jgi:hypothetical protein
MFGVVKMSAETKAGEMTFDEVEVDKITWYHLLMYIGM